MHQEDFYIVALENRKLAKNIFSFKTKKPKIALVLGSEVKGLSSKILNRADMVLEIPMLGKKESLNVAVAFGIAIYQLLK